MRDLFVASVVFGSLPFILRRPFWGILLMAWLGYMNPHRLCYGFMLDMPVVQIVAITTLIGMLMSKEPKRMIWSREIVVLLLFVLWMGFTSIFALYPDAAWVKYVVVIKIQILTVMTLVMLTNKERIRAFVWMIVLSLGFYGVKGGLFTIAHGGVYHVEGPAGTFIGGNNELALALIMTVPLMRYLQLQESHKLVKLGLTGGMLLTIISAIGSQSRGALVGLLITGTIFWAKSRRKLVSAVLIVVAALVVVSLMPEAWYQRMDTIDTYNRDASAMGRINAWHMAWNLASARLTGGGFDTWTGPVFAQFAPAPEDVHDAHSIYFKVLGEHGFVGLFLFLLLLTLAWRKCRKVIRLVGKNPEQLWARDLAAMIQVSMVAYFSAGAFLGLSYFDYIYHLIALTVVLCAMVEAAPAPARVAPLGPGRAPVPGARGGTLPAGSAAGPARPGAALSRPRA
ncbi:MAG: putative O-glycosylation ligase, exosortase A system-associated [Burkholderiales bacterium]|nr:putative O-glycosylation ligase, exosortase A system-associated [Burkholderiales bacterium]